MALLTYSNCSIISSCCVHTKNMRTIPIFSSRKELHGKINEYSKYFAIFFIQLFDRVSSSMMEEDPILPEFCPPGFRKWLNFRAVNRCHSASFAQQRWHSLFKDYTNAVGETEFQFYKRRRPIFSNSILKSTNCSSLEIIIFAQQQSPSSFLINYGAQFFFFLCSASNGRGAWRLVISTLEGSKEDVRVPRERKKNNLNFAVVFPFWHVSLQDHYCFDFLLLREKGKTAAIFS